MDEKSWNTWKSNQKIVMNEELVQNGVMNEELVQNGVMNAKIDPKVVMDRSIFKIDGWNSLQPSNQKLLDEFIDENEPWLLIGSPNRDPFLVTKYLERHSASSDHTKRNWCHFVKVVMRWCNATCDSIWLIVIVARTSRRTCIVETTSDEEIHKRINHVLRKKTCVWMEHSEDAIRIKWIRTEINGFLHKQMENQNSFGELLWRACTRSLGEKLDESCNADFVVERAPSKIWSQQFCRHFMNNPKRMSSWMQLKKLQARYQKSLSSIVKSWKEEDNSGMMSTEDTC